MNLQGKRVLVTGGSSGIGLAIAGILLAKGLVSRISRRRPPTALFGMRTSGERSCLNPLTQTSTASACSS